jgi:integrase
MTTQSPSRNPFVDPGLPSFADLIARLATDKSLPPRKRQNWAWGLRAMARAVGKDPSEVPAHPKYLRYLINRAVPERIGVRSKAWNNVCSFCRAALRWAKLATMPAHYRGPLTPKWATHRDKLPERALGMRLSRLFHFCSAEGIDPEAVNDAILAFFHDAMDAESIVRNSDDVFARTAKAWNRAAQLVPEWPQQRLTVPSRRRTFSLPWGAFPESLQADVEAYMRRAAGADLLDDHFTHAQRPATLRTRRYELQLFATALVKSGIAAETLVDLRVMLVPELAAQGLEYLRHRNNGSSSVSISHLAAFLPALARRLDIGEDAVARLQKFEKKLRIRQQGMTERNRAALRAFDDHAAVEALLTLPQRLLKEAQAAGRKGYRRAKLVQTAVAIETLINAPVRIKNLASIELDRHLLKVGTATHLRFPKQEVKNSIELEFPLMEESVQLLHRYLADWWPSLCNGPSTFLFPGKLPNCPKRKEPLSTQIRRVIQQYTGLEMPPHRMRHAVAKIYLDRNPGQIEVIRLLLGHKDIKTTISIYAGGMESAAAARHYARSILGIRAGAPEMVPANA